MLVDKINTVFVHVPKTGGNFIQKCFLGLGLTSEKMKVDGHQDGQNRFEIRGDLTESKHQSLETYFEKLGKNQAQNLTFLSVWRDPRERLVSLYLSPHRHIRGNGTLAPPTSYDLVEFEFLVSKAKSASQLIEVRQGELPESLYLLNFNELRQGFSAFLVSKGINEAIPTERVNPTTSRSLFEEMLGDDSVLEIVGNSHHVRDFHLPFS